MTSLTAPSSPTLCLRSLCVWGLWSVHSCFLFSYPINLLLAHVDAGRVASTCQTLIPARDVPRQRALVGHAFPSATEVSTEFPWESAPVGMTEISLGSAVTGEQRGLTELGAEGPGVV